MMRNNDKLRKEKEELRSALSHLEEEVWQFRQKEVCQCQLKGESNRSVFTSGPRFLPPLQLPSQLLLNLLFNPLLNPLLLNLLQFHYILFSPPRSSHLSEQTSNALFAMPRRNWRHCAATSNRRNAKDADNNNTLTPQTRKSSRSSTTNISGRRASGRRSFIRNAIYCFC